MMRIPYNVVSPGTYIVLSLILVFFASGCSRDEQSTQREPGCEEGTENCPCSAMDACEAGLVCVSDKCEPSMLLDMPDDLSDSTPDVVDMADMDSEVDTEESIRFVPLEIHTAENSVVSIMVTAENAQTGAPFVELNTADLRVLEDDTPLEDLERVDHTKTSRRVYISLMLDMTEKTSAHMSALKDGARAFVTAALGEHNASEVYVGIRLFDGSPSITYWQHPITDREALFDRIDALDDFTPENPGVTNVHGALMHGLAELQERQLRASQVHEQGIMSTGHLVFLTGDNDTAMLGDVEELKRMIKHARTYQRAGQYFPTVQTSIVGFEEAVLGDVEDLEALLEGDSRWLYTATASTLPSTLLDVARGILARDTATHLLSYCSPSTQDVHMASIGADRLVEQMDGFFFNADVFTESCTSQTFEEACPATAPNACGGLLCGGCDDATEVCEGGVCKHGCVAVNLCQGQEYTMELGYEVVCSEPVATTCGGGVCVDLTENDEHCGACGADCGEFGSCAYGVCVCGQGTTLCADGCVQTDEDRNHCGGCDVQCASSESCEVGTCESGDIREVVAGYRHACALMEKGHVVCWGDNTSGQLGDGTLESRTRGVVVQDSRDFVQVDAGQHATCAVRMDGTVWCWGANDRGQLGDGTRTDRMVPTQVKGIQDAIKVKINSTRGCALLGDGTVWCWGANNKGQLGDGTYTDRVLPVQVKDLTGAVALDTSNNHGCVLHQSGGMRCWGENFQGELGDRTTVDSTEPVVVKGIVNATAIGVGSGFSCALVQGGDVLCWGENSHGELGDGTVTSSLTPQFVQGASNVRQLRSNYSHSCALSGTQMLCWGANLSGQLGVGDTQNRTEATSVQGLPGAVEKITAGWYNGCAVVEGGALWCWGANNFGQLGVGDTQDSISPVLVEF